MYCTCPVEYAWQHPSRCRFTKQRLRQLQGRKGVGAPRTLKRKLVELHEVLHVEPWRALALTVSYTSECTMARCGVRSFGQE